MTAKYKKTKMLMCLLYLLPFIDMLNGYFIRNYNISGVGATYHLILVLTFIVSAYGKKCIKIGKFEKCCISLLLVFIFSEIVNSIIIGDFQAISLERVEKIVSTALTVTCLNRLVETKYISKQRIDNLLNYISIIVSVVSMFANLTGLGNYTYDVAQLGRTGFFTGSNEPIAIYIILNTFLVYKFYISQKISYLLVSLVFEIDLIFAQSKSAYLYSAVFAVLLIGMVVNNAIKKGKIKKSFLLIGLPGLIAGIIAGKKLLLDTLADFWSRQTYIKNNYRDTGFLNYISSGRIGRVYSLIGSVFNQNVGIMIFQFLFGQGLNFKYSEILEIDVLDVFLYGGLIGSLIVMILMISFFNIIRKASLFASLLTLIIYLFSFTAGHIWTGGISGTYFALVIVYYMYINGKETR
jgi:hypothetical protein